MVSYMLYATTVPNHDRQNKENGTRTSCSWRNAEIVVKQRQ